MLRACCSRTLLIGIIVVVPAIILAEEVLHFSIVPNFISSEPNSQPLGPTHGGVVIDKAGNIYVSTDTERGIVVFAPDGKYVRAFGPTRIHSMQLRAENGVEFIYAARPFDHEVAKLKTDGTPVWTMSQPEESKIYANNDEFRPTAIAVTPDGSIFVADGYGKNYIHKYDKNRHYIKSFGGPGEDEGKLHTCHGITVDTRGGKTLLFVCNRESGRVEHWDLDGNFVKVLQRDLRMPAAAHIKGDFAAIAELKGRVTVLGKDNGVVSRIGDNPDQSQWANFNLPPEQWSDGICNSPHAVVFDKDGNLIVAEWSKFGRACRFVRAKS